MKSELTEEDVKDLIELAKLIQDEKDHEALVDISKIMLEILERKKIEIRRMI